MRVAGVIADWLAANTSGRVYAVSGGTAMFLNDAICHHPKLTVIPMHHEQAAAFAAEGDYRASGKVSTVMVTAGPGGTNTLTGVAGAYVDSIPMLIIAGQVATHTMAANNQRQRGMNEIAVLDMATPVTKYARAIMAPEWAMSTLDTALSFALSERPGPVWIDVPIDVQSAKMPGKITHKPPTVRVTPAPSLNTIADAIRTAKRPLLFVGNGVRIAGAEHAFREMIDQWNIPVVASWGGIDLLPTDHPNMIGRPGLFGDRAGNFAVQTADVVIGLGVRMSVAQIGHDAAGFAPNAYKIAVDTDLDELNAKHPSLSWVHSDIGRFIEAIRNLIPILSQPEWTERCRGWRDRYPVVQQKHWDTNQRGMNSYAVVGEMSKHLPSDAIVVVDVGAGAYSVCQGLQIRGTQRLIQSGGAGSMGWALPAAIGACIGSGCKPTVCITGDGGLMMNLQELQTLATTKLPIKVLVFCNGGYMTMQSMQKRHFNRTSISDSSGNLEFPNFYDIASCFGVSGISVFNTDELVQALSYNWAGPVLLSLMMQKEQQLEPCVQSRSENGKFILTPIHDMYPYLDRDVLAREMGGTLSKVS